MMKLSDPKLKPLCSQPPIRNSGNNSIRTDIQKAHTFANHLPKGFLQIKKKSTAHACFCIAQDFDIV